MKNEKRAIINMKKWGRCGRLGVGLFERPAPPEKVYFINGLGDIG